MKLFGPNRKSIVSGSTKGIGFAIASALYGAGITVIVNGRGEDGVGGAIERIKYLNPDSNGQLIGFVGDLVDAKEVDRLYESHPDAEIIVNNIGLYGAVDFDKSTDKDWFDIFDANVMSGVRLSRKYAPALRRTGWGRIVFISSESAINVPVEMIHYGFSKTAQLAISRGLAETFAGTGVTVNSVLPGPTFTDGVQEFVASLGGANFDEFTEEYFRSVRPTSIIKRFSSPEEVGNVVAFVCSELASSITGAAIRVDGGAVKSCF
ncbi:SDR family oxidoreductase [Paraburkholderia sp.]|uniref:SDR family NAD(P)-dependent oxidoreductase n=1 Tax=Paraburkholderia sp. TaxID=1926495 RepID=UPI0025CD5A2C|nr:SDR family oxidoreductase [Paraburkholderia sp.]